MPQFEPGIEPASQLYALHQESNLRSFSAQTNALTIDKHQPGTSCYNNLIPKLEFNTQKFIFHSSEIKMGISD